MHPFCSVRGRIEVTRHTHTDLDPLTQAALRQLAKMMTSTSNHRYHCFRVLHSSPCLPDLPVILVEPQIYLTQKELFALVYYSSYPVFCCEESNCCSGNNFNIINNRIVDILINQYNILIKMIHIFSEVSILKVDLKPKPIEVRQLFLLVWMFRDSQNSSVHRSK